MQDLRGKAVGTSPIYIDRLRKVGAGSSHTVPQCPLQCMHARLECFAACMQCLALWLAAPAALKPPAWLLCLQYGLQPTPYPFNQGSDYLVWR